MGTAAAEEKRTLTLHETKIRDLQTRSLALQDIEKVELTDVGGVSY